MEQLKIIGILIKDRIKEANRTQAVLTNHANIIKSRLGFHEVSPEVCSRVGVVLLQLTGTPNDWKKFEDELQKIGGIEVKDMTFKF